MLSDEWIDGDSPEALNDALPWRRRLAKWPDEWRERWGVRANQLEDTGLDWVEAERQAWNETMVLKRQGETVAKVAAVETTRTQALWKETAA